ncbi:hypothetical protein AB0I98_18555 [Streptomyces sp. NPDC050211]|uniref:hypothetical protein n=1 Tax=Streptomyces sp. NPDC050211 TaxID=3154932 RepID=UPI003421ABEF
MTETADATMGAERPPVVEERAPTGDPGAARGALGELLAPVRGRLVVAVGLQVVSALASLVPFVCVVELAREVLGSAPVDEGRVWALVWVAVGALVLRLVTMGLAGLTTHLADNDLQLQVRRRLADRLGGVPLGWFTDRASGRVKTAVQDDVAVRCTTWSATP